MTFKVSVHFVYQMACQKIFSGGQTGVDRAALDAALEAGFPCGGYCPQGRLAEDGTISEIYPLAEIKGGDYSARTLMNVEEADGTLIIYKNKLDGGTKLTFEFTSSLKKPVFLVTPEKNTGISVIAEILKWIEENNIATLNVAGARLTEWAEGYSEAKKIVSSILTHTIRLTS